VQDLINQQADVMLNPIATKLEPAALQAETETSQHHANQK
jgi:hypothetical protein